MLKSFIMGVVGHTLNLQTPMSCVFAMEIPSFFSCLEVHNTHVMRNKNAKLTARSQEGLL